MQPEAAIDHAHLNWEIAELVIVLVAQLPPHDIQVGLHMHH